MSEEESKQLPPKQEPQQLLSKGEKPKELAEVSPEQLQEEKFQLVSDDTEAQEDKEALAKAMERENSSYTGINSPENASAQLRLQSSSPDGQAIASSQLLASPKSLRELSIKFVNSSQQDSIERALHLTREIPLETYMNFDKVAQVRAANNKRNKNKKGTKPDDQSESRFADSSFVHTEFADLTEVQRRKERNKQYREVAHFKAHDDHLVRAFLNRSKLQKMTIQKRIEIKHKKQEKRKKKRDDDTVGSTGAVDTGYLSSFSQTYADAVPVVSRTLQNTNRAARPGRRSIEPVYTERNVRAMACFHSVQRSLIPNVDGKENKSVAMSGMMVTKNKKLQTLCQTDLVPEIVYSNIEGKVRDLIYNLVGPTINRQKDIEKKQLALLKEHHLQDGRLRDCQLWIKKQQNVKEELDGIVARIEATDLSARKIGAGLNNVEARLDGKCESIAAQVRVLKSEVKSSSRFIEKNNQDKTKLQEILNSFKDRLMEKYRVLADEYTSQFKTIEQRYMGCQEHISKISKEFELVFQIQKDIKVDQALDAKNLDDAVEQIDALKSCYKFDQRIHTLENQAKSDLMAVTLKMQESIDLDKYNMKRTEALKLMYSVQMDIAHKVMGIDKQKDKVSGKRALSDRFDPYTQASLNLLEWQVAFNKLEPFDRDKAIVISKDYTKSAETNMRKLRTEHLIVTLNARYVKERKKLERGHSVPLRLIKIDLKTLPKVDMPEVKKKVVVFARENTILGMKPEMSTTDLQPQTQTVQSMDIAAGGEVQPKSPKKSNLRKFNKLLEPFKKREIKLLSMLKRSNSFQWTPVAKTTIDNLYNDPNRPAMLGRLQQSIKSDTSNEVASPRRSKLGFNNSGPKRQQPSRKHLRVQETHDEEKGTVRMKKDSKRSSDSVTNRLKVPSSQQLPVPKVRMQTMPVNQSEDEEVSSMQGLKKDSKGERKSLTKKPSSLRQARALPHVSIESDHPTPHETLNSDRSSKKSASKFKKRRVSKRPSEHSQKEVLSSNLVEGLISLGTESKQSKHLQTVDEEQKTPLEKKASKMVDLPTVSDAESEQQSKQNSQSSEVEKSSRPATVISEKSVRSHSKKKKVKAKKKSKTSESEDKMFSSSESEVDIHPAYYNEFVSQEDFHEEMDDLKEEMRTQILQEARQQILAEADEMIEEKVEQAQFNMTTLLEEQLALSQDRMKEMMTKEVSTVKKMAENIEQNLLPENIIKVEKMVARAKGEQKSALDDCINYVSNAIQKFATKLEYFQIEVDSIMTKFKRIVSDQEVFKDGVRKTLHRTKEMVRVMRSEQLAVTKLTSTLVELEFIQQSLDFQDEFDKTQMNLYGLNDLNMSLNDFISKSSEIAQRKVHHDALQQASDLELEQLGETNVKKGFFEMTDSGTYQAIEMSNDWPEHLTDDHLRKQIHQAFKMACVYYKPSPVLYRGHKYNRRALIEAKRMMLDAEWQLMQKFQPYKRLWGDESGVDFFDQFTSKLDTLIQAKKNGVDVASIMEISAHETFVKIMSGTNIYDMKLRDAEDHDELMSSGDFEVPEEMRLASAIKDNSPRQQISISRVNIGTETSQSSTAKLLPGEEHDMREQIRLKHKPFEVISNRKKVLSQDRSVSNTIDNRTQSMLKAMQGKSMFGQGLNESTFSTEDMDNTTQSKSKTRLKHLESQTRIKGTRSVQQKIDAAAGTAGLLNDIMMHTPGWLNQSPAIQEQTSQNNLDASKRFNRISDNTPGVSVNSKSKTRNSKALRHHFNTHNQSQPEVFNNSVDFSRDNPLVEMRPLMGKEQLNRFNVQSMRGLALPDLDHGLPTTVDGDTQGTVGVQKGGEIVMPGRTTQFSVSPWMSKHQPAVKGRYKEKPGHVSLMQQQLDIAVVGQKDFSSANLLDRKLQYHQQHRPKKGSAGLGASGAKNAKQQILQSPMGGHPFSIPASLSMSGLGLNSPQATGGGGINHALSHAVLTLPAVETPNKGMLSYTSLGVGGSDLKIVSSKGVAGAKKMFLGGVNSGNIQETSFGGGKPHNTNGRSNTTSYWGAEDEVLDPGKMQAKLGESGDIGLDTQKLKEIARQKKKQHVQSQQPQKM